MYLKVNRRGVDFERGESVLYVVWKIQTFGEKYFVCRDGTQTIDRDPMLGRLWLSTSIGEKA